MEKAKLDRIRESVMNYIYNSEFKLCLDQKENKFGKIKEVEIDIDEFGNHEIKLIFTKDIINFTFHIDLNYYIEDNIVIGSSGLFGCKNVYAKVYRLNNIGKVIFKKALMELFEEEINIIKKQRMVCEELSKSIFE